MRNKEKSWKTFIKVFGNPEIISLLQFMGRKLLQSLSQYSLGLSNISVYMIHDCNSPCIDVFYLEMGT